MTPKISSTLSIFLFLGVALAAPSPPASTRIPSSQLLLGKVPPCSSDHDCASGTACVFSVGCVSHQDLTSQPGFLGDVCASSQLCSNGIRCWNAALDKEENGVCGIYGAPCDNDSHCAFGTTCVHQSGRGLCFGSPSTVPPLSSSVGWHPTPSSSAPVPISTIPSSQGYKDHVPRCSSDRDCSSGNVCVDAVGCVPHADLTAQPGRLGDICASSANCLNGVKCWASSTQSEKNGVCGVYGAPCSNNSHCTFGNTCNNLGLCSGGHFGVPSLGEMTTYPTPPTSAPVPISTIPSSQGYKDHVPRCSSDRDCSSGNVCVDAVGCVPQADLTAQPGRLGDICASSANCLNGVKCWASTTQSEKNGVCGVYGAPCSSNSHCTFGNTCNNLGLCSGGDLGVPSLGAYPTSSAGSYRGAAGENVNIHAAAGVGDGAEVSDSETFLGLNFNTLKTYGIAGIALLSLNALLLISLIAIVVVLKNKKPQQGSPRPHYQKRDSFAAYGKLDSEVESLRK